MLISANTGLRSLRPGRLRFDMLDTVDFFAEAGFEAMDVNFCATVYSGEFMHEPILDGDWVSNIERLRERIEQRGLRVYQTHLPFRYNYETDKKYYEDEMMMRSIRASKMLGASFAVSHPIHTPDHYTLIPETLAAYRDISRAAEDMGITLAMENMFHSTAEEMIEIADTLGCAICWDAGHANIGGFSQADSLRLIGKHLGALHLHDNYGTKDCHNAPYFGNIDWNGLVSVLGEIGYSGAFNYEVIRYNIPDELYMHHAEYLVKAARLMLGR